MEGQMDGQTNHYRVPIERGPKKQYEKNRIHAETNIHKTLFSSEIWSLNILVCVDTINIVKLSE